MNARPLEPEPNPAFLDNKNSPAEIKQTSELIRHSLTLTSDEQTLMASNATQNGLGTAGILSSFHLFAFYTPLEQGGLGIILGTTPALISLSVMSLGTLLLTVPLSLLTYDEYIQEATTAINNIIKAEKLRQIKRENLFLDLISLRCLFEESEAAFNQLIETLDLDNEEIDSKALINHVNQLYLNPAFKTHAVHHPPEHDAKQLNSERKTLISILNKPLPTIETKRKEITNEIRRVDRHFEEKLNTCFRVIPALNTVNQWTAAKYGMRDSIGMLGALFGTASTFAGIFIAAGLATALSFTGWGALLVAAIVISIIFGAGVGIAKQKNLQREELKSQIEKRNKIINISKEKIASALADKQDAKREADVREKHDLKYQLQQERSARIQAESRLAQYDPTTLAASKASNLGFFARPALQQAGVKPILARALSY